MEILTNLPKELINFILVAVFSLLLGLEQRRLHIELDSETLFGTDRTITLIGILGYILYTVMPTTLTLYFGGGVIISALLGIYYYNKIKLKNKWGFTSIVTALIAYSFTPLVDLEPLWLIMLVVVTTLIVVEMKESLFNLTRKFDSNEFTLLAKFIIIAGIILPLLPHTQISDFITISPYQIWVSIVAVTGISYLSYLLRKFVFPDSGIILSAILGGLYSSTATTIILARKSKIENNNSKIVTGIFGATSMMYIRIQILAWIFNPQVAVLLLPYFLIFLVVNLAVVAIPYFKNKPLETKEIVVNSSHNPLEFKTALSFGLLFAFFAVLTNFVVSNYGNAGVNILSFIVGVSDIAPYILNLFQQSGNHIEISTIVNATIIGTISNNLMKMIYTISIGSKEIRKNIIIGFSTLIMTSVVVVLLLNIL